MIGALKGSVYLKSHNSILLFVGGVGYRVQVTDRFLKEIHADREVLLFIHSHIREDMFDLFGFPTREELNLFKLLLTVSGVGPKTALTVIGHGVSSITRAVQKSDVDFFTTIPRLGKKNAQKIIIELKQKLGSLTDIDLSEETTSETKQLFEALSSMGFAKQEIQQVIKTLPAENDTLEQKIRYCLKHLGKAA